MSWRFIMSLGLLLAVGAAKPLHADTLPLDQSHLWRDASPAEVDADLDRLSRAYTRLAATVRPAVVQIRVIGSRQTQSEANPQREVASRGSGFVIHPAGYILTANHVVEGSKIVEARTASGQRLVAKIVVADAQIDLAVLKVDSAQEMPSLPLGDSDDVRVGDLAVVFGYPFGRESSMNLGIISRPGKSYSNSASYDMIQTDAGAYPGGSGGPLLNGKGHVVGMITMASERGNMGFAVPVNVLKRVIPRLMRGERLVWGWLGVQMSEISLEQAKQLGLSPVKGVLVRSVLRGQPAEQGGVLSQDVILAINDTQVDSPREVLRMIGGLEAGQVVKLTILRSGRTLQLPVALGTKPDATKVQEQ